MTEFETPLQGYSPTSRLRVATLKSSVLSEWAFKLDLQTPHGFQTCVQGCRAGPHSLNHERGQTLLSLLLYLPWEPVKGESFLHSPKEREDGTDNTLRPVKARDPQCELFGTQARDKEAPGRS